MNEKLMKIWAKIVENKTTIMRVGLAVAGAVVGVVVASLVANSQDEELLDDMLMDEEEN
jgi:flagellar biosynthesis/type III secretory pathway M-ring protein FliF/YscJ